MKIKEKETFENQKEEVLFLLTKRHFLTHSKNCKECKLIDEHTNEIKTYSIHLLNNLLDEKLITHSTKNLGRFIQNKNL
jgi:hypothetical protein